MRTLLTALVLTAGVYACASDKPAESPTTGTTSSSSMSTTSSSTPAAMPASTATSTTTTSDPSMGASNGSMPSTAAPSTNPAPAPASAAAPLPDNSKNADNTKQNERDRNSTLTPMDQGGGKDRDITAAIRKSVVGDGSLSFDAKNVKIITVGGKVTLRGAVKSDAEKTAIETKSKAVAGVTSVDNQLDVKK